MVEKTFHGVPCRKCSHTLRYTISKHCVACNQERSRAHRIENPDYMKNYKQRPDVREGLQKYNKEYKLLRAYGINLTEYYQLVSKQNGRCSICKASANLFVDHTHQTGKIRGLLCKDCNIVLGIFKDDPTRFQTVALYLEQETPDGN